jgi:hypothetical protein
MACGFNGQFQQIAFCRFWRRQSVSQAIRLLFLNLVLLLLFQVFQPVACEPFGCRHRECATDLPFQAIFVYTDNNILSAVYTRLFARRRFFDAQFRNAGFNRFCHAAKFFNFFNEFPCRLCNFGRQAFNIITAGPRVDGFVILVSSCKNNWVFRAIRAEKSVGNAMASSNALVCNDWVPPKAAAAASIVVRATLLNGSCSVKLQPEVWQWVRNAKIFHLSG